MSFWDAVLGRTRPVKPRMDPLFALSTALITIETELDWVPAGRAGVVLRPASSQDFRQAVDETESLLQMAVREMDSRSEILTDEYGYRWVIVSDPDWDDLVALVHIVGTTLQEKDFGEQLLAAVFRLGRREQPSAPCYLIYNYKRGTFYPFFPRSGQRQERDHGEEMHVYSLLEKELLWEKDLSRWYPLWGCPV